MARTGGGWIFKAVVGLLAVGAAVALAAWLAGGPDERAEGERGDRGIESKRSKLVEERRQLEAIMKSRRSAPPAATGLEEPPPAGDAITQAEGDALRAAFDRVYDPKAIADALADRRAAEIAGEIARRYQELAGVRALTLQGREVPVGGAVAEAIRRMGVAKDYAMNVAHAMRPVGEEAQQGDMIRRVNDGFRDRIDALNRDYPFLGMRMLEP